MIRYVDIVNYVKENRVNWNTDVFDILKGYFSQYSEESIQDEPVQQEIIFPSDEGFTPPKDGHYSVEDVLNLLR